MSRFLVVVAVLIAACDASPESTAGSSGTLTFIHLNDTYRVGAVEDGTRGGFGRVVTVIRELQGEGRDVRILHGGDFLYPSLESQLWDGQQMVDAFNFMDAIAPMHVVAGNHEFDRRTPEQLVAALQASQFDWLGDNYRFDTGDPEADALLRQRFTFEHGGRTIGVFALTLHADVGGNAREYAPVERDAAAAARREIERLEGRGVDAIIGVTHLHMRQDLEIAKLKAAHPRFVFIVGGHEHETQYSAGSDDQAAVMKGTSNAREIWRIDLRFDGQGLPVIEEHPLVMDAGVAPDPQYEELVHLKWRTRLLDRFPFLTARIGRAAVTFDATEEAIRSAENGWGNFIVDQMRTAYGEPAADLAFINSGTLRIDDTIAGDIVFEDVGRTFGYSSYLRYMTIGGGEFREIIEAGYRGEGYSQGYFPQVSGFRVCVDRARPSGERIVSLQLPSGAGWAEIEPKAEYMLVVPDFLYRGGDGYELPQDRPASLPGSELKYLVLDAILRAQAEGRAVGAAPDPANPRYVELTADRSDCWANS